MMMKHLKITVFLFILPFIEVFIINRYIRNILEISILFSFAVYISLKEEKEALILVFIIGLISDIFNNDIIGLNAIVFTIISFLLYYSKNFVIIASKMAEFLILIVSFTAYFFIKILFIQISGYGPDMSNFIMNLTRTLFVNILSGILLFMILDLLKLYTSEYIGD